MGIILSRFAGGKEPVMREGISNGAMSWKKEKGMVEKSIICAKWLVEMTCGYG